MAFDPDAFLAETSSDQPTEPQTEFDPDQYLQEGIPVLSEATGVARSLLSSAAGEMTGGWEGIEAGINPLDPRNVGQAVEETQQWWADIGTPGTQRGREATQQVGEFMQWLSKGLRYPASGVGGLYSLIASGGDIDQAMGTLRDVQERGIGPALGDKVFDETGSPWLAAMAYATPEAVLSAYGGRLAAMPSQRRHSQLQQRIADDILALPEGTETAGRSIQVRNPQTGRMEPVRTTPEGLPRSEAEASRARTERVESVEPSTAETIRERVRLGTAKVGEDFEAQSAIGLGWDPAAIGMIKSSSPTDYRKFNDMLDLHEAAQKSARAGITRRPSDIAGDTVLERVNHVNQVRKDAGQQLDNVVKDLVGQPVNINAPMRQFVTRLVDDLGVEIDQNMNLRFPEDSAIKFNPKAQRDLNKIFKRMRDDPSGIDAKAVHGFKKQLDELLVFGKTLPGAGGQADRIIKEFRAGLNQSIRDISPEYERVNRTYEQTKTALDKLQESMGAKIDLEADNANTKIGQELRKVMSNYRGRADVYQSVMDMDATAKKYGLDFEDDAISQVVFADELDRALGSSATRRSFENLIQRGTQKGIESAVGGPGIIGELVDQVADFYGKARHTPERRVQVMRDLISRPMMEP